MAQIATRFALLISVFFTIACEKPAEQDAVIQSVDVYEGNFATVNSFIFSNGQSLAVLDVQRKWYEAEKLIAKIKAKNLPLSYILISHGHTDHFTGLDYVMKAFPEAKVVVANENIKKAIKAYAIYMHGFGSNEDGPILDPTLIPKSPENPDGFDYENNIHVLNADRLTLPGGGTLELTTDYLPNEAEFMTTVYSPDLNGLFISDLGYNDVHHWQGDDISWQDIANWRSELRRIQDEYADRNPDVYPGHGKTTDLSGIDDMVQYIDDYKRIVQNATSRQQAKDEIVALYPNHKEADFFLKYSLMNHIKE